LNIDYYGKFENINGNIEVEKGKTIDLKFLGTIGKFTYGDFVIEKIKYEGSYINDILNISQLTGTQFSLNGIYDIKNESGNLDINEVIIPINKGKLSLKGNINYRNNLITLNKLYAGESLIEGSYNTLSGDYKLDAKIFEKHLFRYLGTDEVNGVLSGNIIAKGKKESIDLKTNLKLVNNFSNGRELPRIYFQGKYQAKDLTQGTFIMEKIEIDNLENQKLLSLNGKYDVKENYLEILLPQQTLDMYKVKHFIGGTPVEGKLHLIGKLSGKVDELTYSLNLNKGIVILDEIRLGGLQGNVTGNLEKLELRDFRVNYLNNLMTAKGDVDLKNGNYLINLRSNEIDLGFLNAFLKKYKIQDIKGDSVFNINLSNKGNNGYLKVKDFSLVSNEYLLTLQNVNSVINLEDKRVKIQSLQGTLNEGDISLKGYIDIPESTDIENSLELKSLNYEFQLNLKNIQYGYQKYFNLSVSSDLFLKEETLRGTVTIDKGIVNDIPAIQINIFKMIYDFLFERDRNEDIRKSLGKNYESTHSYEKDMKIDVYFKIKNGIKLDIPYVTAFVEDLKGDIFGQGNFIGEDGEILFLGNVELLNSSFVLNGTNFNVERGLVIFDKKKDFFPDVNPMISFTAKSKSWKNPLTLSLNGNLKDLNLSTGTSRWGEEPDASNLTSLFGGGNEENQAEASAFLLKGVIDSQASLVLKPLSKMVKDTFHIQKFKIVSDVVTNENANQGTSDYFGFGAYIEAEDSIYKDKLYWVAKVNLISQTQSETNVRDDKTAGAVDKYDFSIIYKINSGFSVGVGVEKLSDELVKKSSEKSGRNINYHIDFLFEKRYDSLMNIFRGN
jgi:cytoskeletal protein CcmA (bactofilin family)